MEIDMKIREWLGRLSYELVQGSLDTYVEDVIYDSRKAEENTVFEIGRAHV